MREIARDNRIRHLFVHCPRAAYVDNEQWQEILATLGNREGGTHVKMNKGKKYIYLTA